MFLKIGGYMKKLLLSLVIPFQAFCCQSCIDTVQQRIERESEQIERIQESYIDNEELLIYMHGRLDTCYDILFLLQIQGSCP
jgi:hypothetical protein